MAFCTKCGAEAASDDSFCRKCGAPRRNTETPADPIKTAVVGVVERDAQIRLSREHSKLVAGLGVAGGLAVIVLTIALLVIADRMERLLGELFLAVVAFGSVALFVASLVSADFAESVNRTLGKADDPMTGKPLGMLWWFRWFTAMLGLFLFIGLSDYVNPPPNQESPPQASATASTSDLNAPVSETEKEQAKNVFCDAVYGRIQNLAKGEKPSDQPSTEAAALLLSANRIYTQRYSVDEWRAQKILGAALQEITAKDPDGNFISYCDERARQPGD